MLEQHIPLRMTLGEGPVWDDQLGQLFWVDITAGALYRLNAETGEHEVLHVDEALACVALHPEGGFLAGLRSGIWRLDDDGSKQQQLVSGPQQPELAWCNDARCDRHGRLWIGTKHADETHPEGALFSFQGALQQHLDGITISNGLAFSPDDAWLYHADTPSRIIHRHPFDIEQGTIGPGEVFADLNQLDIDGHPDGAAVDENGHYWVALYGGGAVAHFDEHGKLLERHRLLAPNPTKVTFGDADRCTLYVTTANQGLTEEQLEGLPESGSLFSMRVETPGLPDQRYQPLQD
ncbi:sugar lactone lactonase YvrE [Kushneria sinocarnis]|uniref:Sugar lactone lactonase YvrE n=1 Tax=Kushneria sinocarnis TaxID=595502 RepID=A0A420WZN1_9GAMM|nr:SMP-30/gluconolactonase/LRE family protein [Kushneria sinocarnis]RKR06791.1 sugar lactone lactonase YvrE [Kushneria sinocarnis]